MMSRLIIFLAALIISTGLYGQDQGTFRGSVKDRQTGEPLVGANIILKLDRSFGTAADVDGKFTLLLSRDSIYLNLPLPG